MSIASFYRTDRWGSRWGVVDKDHPTPHKGLDVAQNMAGVGVPALRSGRLVSSGPSSSVGHYVTVQVAPNDFDTYCHIVATKRINTDIDSSEILGSEAGFNDPHGTAWTGPHIHVCRSRTKTGWATWTANNLDPTPVVLAALHGTTAGSDGSGTIHHLAEDSDMELVRQTIGAASGLHLWDPIGGFYFLTIPEDQAFWLNRVAAGAVTLNDVNGTAGLDPYIRKTMQANANLGRAIDQTQFAGLTEADLAAIDTLDDDEHSALLAAIHAIPAGGSSAFPTAEEIAAEVIRQMKLPGN